jgi:hypothetical protein
MTLDLGDDTAGQVLSRVVIESHVSAFPRENVAQRCANTPRATGYERALTFEQ